MSVAAESVSCEAKGRCGTAVGLSIIIPVLNEGARIGRTLEVLAPVREAGAELVVVDGGSGDDTLDVVRAAGIRVIDAPTGRAPQQNAGAADSHGRLLAFLHADTLPGPQAQARLLQLADIEAPLWGRFDVAFDDGGLLFSIIARAMNLRSRVSAVATGDQLIFVSRSLFEAVGGFPAIPIMEDVALSKRLRSLSRPVNCREPVITSARRWRRQGPLLTVLRMWCLRLAYFLGADPTRLAAAYRARETDST